MVNKKTNSVFVISMMMLSIFSLLVIFTFSNVQAVRTEYTWTGTSDGETWEDNGNWDVGGSYPDDAEDVAIFPTGISDNILTPSASALTIGELDMQSGFTGTVKLQNNLIIDDSGSCDGSFKVINGTFNCSTYDLDIDGPSTINSTVPAPT